MFPTGSRHQKHLPVVEFALALGFLFDGEVFFNSQLGGLESVLIPVSPLMTLFY